MYYGDEIGMRNLSDLPSKEGAYNRTGARTPMQWDRSVNRGFSTATADSLYLPTDASADAPVVAEQLDDTNSLLRYVSGTIEFRRVSPALSASSPFERVRVPGSGYPLCFVRWCADERLVVCINPTDLRVDTSIPVPWRADGATVAYGDPAARLTATPDGARVELGAVSGAVFRLR